MTMLPILLLPFFPLALAAPYCALTAGSVSATSSASTPAATSKCTSSASTRATTNGTSDFMSAAWYPGWQEDYPPADIPWEKYTLMTFAFGTTTFDPSVIALDSLSESRLPDFVANAQANNVSALLSIGGWTGSRGFSPAVATAENRTTFIQTIVNLVNTYNLTGIDFDWEYPNKDGIGCNVVSANDSANFLTFLQELRQDETGSKLYLSAAVGITPFAGSDGEPMTDVSEFAQYLDHIAIMAYDIWGSWSTTVGPNAPLNDTCATNGVGSVVSAVKAWTTAGFPASQIAVGVASYGHSFHVDDSNALASNGSLKLYPTFDASQQPAGDSDNITTATQSTDICGNPGGISGVFNFWGLIDGGFLTENGTAAEGIDYIFDDCSQTPYVYNSTSQVMVSFDDATSFAAKGRYISDTGLKGFAMWNVAGDSNDILLDAINEALGTTVDDEC
ncbi:glycoside hydrolase family 18 protein [Desarmillaria tabescens]|uniref:Glycoside hydrolase family 18 protein n=1 Tax=Armillaria tabescens TaxID=1929756 RepID=A0AA39JVB9_ARMTA|nr:glycoside hydrolase family 18 protein [Desarmillaria tabescens]KAK0449602.1 glycoside hydrolase family 18 protein [Desarmillaria tabescens]